MSCWSFLAPVMPVGLGSLIQHPDRSSGAFTFDMTVAVPVNPLPSDQGSIFLCCTQVLLFSPLFLLFWRSLSSHKSVPAKFSSAVRLGLEMQFLPSYPRSILTFHLVHSDGEGLWG
mmetsp:Transcript_8765/g.13908  ORF Transcript_8765/g.13908 Transcript_8765/m.13908 type:complete len:116 (+) Transcript_8765:135-482(+)